MTPSIAGRQLFGGRSTTHSSFTPHCTPFKLPSAGIISVDSTLTLTLASDVVFQPQCTSTSDPSYNNNGRPSELTPVTRLRDAFYASTLPQIYALSATTTLSYMLVIMLLITPRTFFFGSGSSATVGRRGIIGGAQNNNMVMGVGSRPWLQKVATVTVAISLTIASADTFKVAQQQYDAGYMDASALRDKVVAGLEIRIVRVISDTFLWLAQVQTLIRLFPRHKEKVIIKWTGFALIILDTIFSILNSFVFAQTARPRTFVDAIPALSYLFQLALSLLYAAWVIYYSLSKRRFAFWHPRMRNICLVALLAVVAILIPVVFFVLDISKPDVSGWGDYVRWVGAAAASVVVWEWVERIEALEREDRKDGVLGREVFDGDEMLETTPSEEVSSWPGLNFRHNHHWRSSDDDDSSQPPPPAFTAGGPTSSATEGRWAGLQRQIRPRFTIDPPNAVSSRQTAGMMPASRPLVVPKILHTANKPPSPPPPAVTPSRSDTISAASTVYAVHYHPVSEATPPPPQTYQHGGGSLAGVVEDHDHHHHHHGEGDAGSTNDDDAFEPEPDITFTSGVGASNPTPQSAGKANKGKRKFDFFFKRGHGNANAPPAEVSTAAASAAATAKSRVGTFTARMRPGNGGRQADVAALPVTVIPAQTEVGRTWSPGDRGVG